MGDRKYTVEELMKETIKESHKSIPEHNNKTDPLVGAIIATEDGVILGMAHRGELREGEHCEFTLIERKLRDKNLNGCVLYVTLEPCIDESRNNSEGRPSLKRGCSTHIKRARLSKVYIGIEDPNPKIAKKGIQFLIDSKVEVEMQLPQLLYFVRDKAFKLTIDRSKGRREEKADFPFEIVREAIVNAIIHRDYSIRGATNYMYIDTNKIVVRSPGGTEPPISMEMLKELKAPSVSRNPEIMFVFNQMELAEQRGVGLRDMRKLPGKGFPLPVFELKTGNIEVTFGRTKEFIAERAGFDNLYAFSEDDKNIIIFIQERKEISTGELAEHFSLHSKAAQRKLIDLVNKGLLIKTGEKRGTRYAINPDIKL